MSWSFFLPLGVMVLLLVGLLKKYWHSAPKVLLLVLVLSFLPIIYSLLVSKAIGATFYEDVFDQIIMRTMYPFMYLAFIGGIVSMVSLMVYGIATLLKK